MPAWIAVDAHLEDHPKFPAFCHASGLTPAQAVHCLIRLWSLVRRRGADGLVTGFGPSMLDTVLGYPKCVDALIKADYVRQDDATGGLIIVGWHEWNGQWLRDAKRKRLERLTKPSGNGVPSRPRSVLGQSRNVRAEQEQEQESERLRSNVKGKALLGRR